MKKLAVVPFVLLAILLMTSVAFANDFSGVPMEAFLLGANEVPNPGDPDGSGYAFLRLNPGQEEVCWEITYTDIGTATAAHIHLGAAGVPGGVVVPLNTSSGCRTANRDLILAIIQNPENYYVNVHTAVNPGGAIRGQLSFASPGQ